MEDFLSPNIIPSALRCVSDSLPCLYLARWMTQGCNFLYEQVTGLLQVRTLALLYRGVSLSILVFFHGPLLAASGVFPRFPQPELPS